MADFGLSRKIVEATSDISKLFDIISYMDSKYLNDKNQNKNYKLNKKSDVYSIGVLMWQILSRRKPFYEANYDILLALAIVNGRREEIINKFPIEYSNLYQSK